ncbi:hypothetical protein CC86DRAFT_349360 [Ophiobolus disseminans]|uniref:3'-5' exonuclease domain-containing protein n=1 Tax=Ophiobolus disseminans TaxID=1469910 RepID=A0A6A7A4G5_9PLEO|nr:hypothetical protein CC86DRAFT_349360 [Ophiobolus disseminans]
MPPASRTKKYTVTATVSKRRGRPPKKSGAKGKGKAVEPGSRKRPATKTESDVDEPPVKLSRTDSKANIGRKIETSDGSSNVASTSASNTFTLNKIPPHEIIVLSDDETDTEGPISKKTNQSPPRMLRALKTQPQTTRVPVPGTFSKSSGSDLSWSFSKAVTPDSTSGQTIGPSSQKMTEDNEKLQKNQRELQATVEKLKQEIVQMQADSQLGIYKADQKNRQELAKMTRDFEAERQEARAAAAERDQLRNQLREYIQEAVSAKDAQQAKHENELQAVQNLLDQQIEARKQDEKRHEELLEDILKSQAARSDPRIEALEDEKTRLAKEIETLKTPAKLYGTHSTLSPAPFQSSTDEDKREDNVRKMYIKTKRQYDILHSVANNLVTCTRSMDLSSFGEFGMYVKKLRASLDVDDSARDRHALVLRRVDDDDDNWGSQNNAGYSPFDLFPLLEPARTLSMNLYIDLEGAKLSRNGTISLLTLYVLPDNLVYLIDIHNLGAAAFITRETSNGEQPHSLEAAVTLKSLLESPTVPKVFFDVRNDSDALFSHYSVSLKCVDDLQLMELATTGRRSRSYVNGLAKCIQHDSGISSSQLERARVVKEQGTKLFAPEKGGSYEVFNTRPLNPIVQEYCVMDVVLMPQLWKTYHGRMSAFWEVMIKEAGEARVKESQSSGYKPNGEWKKYGCWSERVIAEAQKKWKAGQKTGLCG